ncbi:hypothetical protein HDU67_005331, partial [Dinochytrium kinnereticum]
MSYSRTIDPLPLSEQLSAVPMAHAMDSHPVAGEPLSNSHILSARSQLEAVRGLNAMGIATDDDVANAHVRCMSVELEHLTSADPAAAAPPWATQFMRQVQRHKRLMRRQAEKNQHQMQLAQRVMQQSLREMQRSQKVLNNKVDGVASQVRKLEIRSDNNWRRLQNRASEVNWLPLAKETDGLLDVRGITPSNVNLGEFEGAEPQVGSIPEAIFPLDGVQLTSMKHSDVLKLASWYNDDFGIVATDSLSQRIEKLRIWIKQERL